LIAGTSMGGIVGAVCGGHAHFRIEDLALQAAICEVVKLVDVGLTTQGCCVGAHLQLHGENPGRQSDLCRSAHPLAMNATDIVSGSEVIFKEGVVDAVRHHVCAGRV
jgi:predicted acylesterase/phospholipase RssA